MGLKPEKFLGKVYRPLDWSHDLTSGERSYLKEHGISAEDFDRLDPVAQHDWFDECKNPAYESMRNYKGK